MGVVQDALMESTAGRVERVYRRDGVKMWRALVGFTGDRELANDALQEAFTRALHHGDGVGDVAAWTWRVAFRVAAAELAQRKKEVTLDDATPDETPGTMPDLVAALRRLPPKQRLAVVLHDYADRPTTEVAHVLGCSRATVHVHLSTGRRRLRDLLGDDDA
jgi:RNA polymerase sigma-70 factor (ECF subfamily)